MGHRIGEKEGLYVRHATKLDALNPLAVLKRGYTAVFDAENKVVSTVQSVTTDQILTLHFADGSAKTQVLKVERKEK